MNSEEWKRNHTIGDKAHVDFKTVEKRKVACGGKLLR